MLVDELAKNMQMGKQTDIILLEFSKAFDKIAHERTSSETSSPKHQRRHPKMDIKQTELTHFRHKRTA